MSDGKTAPLQTWILGPAPSLGRDLVPASDKEQELTNNSYISCGGGGLDEFTVFFIVNGQSYDPSPQSCASSHAV